MSSWDLRANTSLWDDRFSMFKLKNSSGWPAATVFVWALVALTGWYWTQEVIAAGKPPWSAVHRSIVLNDVASPATLSRLMGASPATVAGPGPGPSDRFVLSGVIASNVGQGAALIAVDGKPARPFAVGSELAPGYVLVSVAPREAMLAEKMDAPVRSVLSLPLLNSVQTSTASGMSSTITGVMPSPALPASAGSTGSSGTPPIAPAVNVPESPVPARADARRQPQTMSPRVERRSP